jgi:hypothetical protein
MTKHTPAPWTVKEINGQEFVSAAPYEGHPYFGCSSTIEIMSEEEYPTKSADARLIAAAPDLLEACKNAVQGCKGMGWSVGNQLEAAIAKAEAQHD